MAKDKLNLILGSIYTAATLLVLFFIISVERFSPEPSVLISKVGFAYLFASAILFVWLFIANTISLSAKISQTLSMDRDAEKLLLDIRDGTRRYYKERRGFFRVKSNMTVQLLRKDTRDFIKTLDLSSEGALLNTTYNFQLGEMIEFRLYLTLFPQPIYVKARVVRTATIESPGRLSTYNVGVKYLAISDNDRQKLTETLNILNRTS